jgi:LEA14-like dessication related protein
MSTIAMTRHFVILLLSLSLFGCNSAYINDLVATPEIKNIQLSHFSVQEKKAVFTVSLYNPNPFPLPISAIAGDIALNNLTIGSLEAKSNQNLAALGTQDVTLPLSLNPDALLNAAQSVLLQGKASYTFNGDVQTSLGRVPFTKEGELSAQDIMGSILPSFR